MLYGKNTFVAEVTFKHMILWNIWHVSSLNRISVKPKNRMCWRVSSKFENQILCLFFQNTILFWNKWIERST